MKKVVQKDDLMAATKAVSMVAWRVGQRDLKMAVNLAAPKVVHLVARTAESKAGH